MKAWMCTKMLVLGPLLLLAGCVDFLSGEVEEPLETGLICSNPAPLHEGEDAIPNQYIVVYKDNVADAETLTTRLAKKHHFAPKHIYTHALKGFAAELSAEALAGLRCESAIDYVSPDQLVSIGD